MNEQLLAYIDTACQRKEFQDNAKLIVGPVVEKFLMDLLNQDFNIFYPVDSESFTRTLQEWICKKWYNEVNTEEDEESLHSIVLKCNMRYRVRSKPRYFYKRLNMVFSELISLSVCSMLLKFCHFIPPDINRLIAAYV